MPLPTLTIASPPVAPFCGGAGTGAETKHVCGCWVPAGTTMAANLGINTHGGLIFFGGDYTGGTGGGGESYQQSVYTLDLFTNTWVLQCPPFAPTDPRPHQPDMTGVFYDGLRNRVIEVAGLFIAASGTSPVGAYSYTGAGNWSLITDMTSQGSNGMERGGVYDLTNDTVYTFAVSPSLGNVTIGWNPVDWSARLFTVPWTGSLAALDYQQYNNSQPAIIGRFAYIVGDETFDGSTFFPRAWKFNLDTHVMTRIADPPMNPGGGGEGSVVVGDNTLIGVSNGKLVLPYTLGPDSIVTAMLVYTPSTDTWFADMGLPPGNALTANTVITVKDGSERVWMCGRAFVAPQQLSWYTYTAAP